MSKKHRSSKPQDDSFNLNNLMNNINIGEITKLLTLSNNDSNEREHSKEDNEISEAINTLLKHDKKIVIQKFLQAYMGNSNSEND